MDSYEERTEFSEFKGAHLLHEPMSCYQEVPQKAPRGLPGLLPDGKAITMAFGCGNNNNNNKKNPHRHSDCLATIIATHIPICQQNQCLQQKNKTIYIFRHKCFIWKMSVPVAP